MSRFFLRRDIYIPGITRFCTTLLQRLFLSQTPLAELRANAQALTYILNINHQYYSKLATQ